MRAVSLAAIGAGILAIGGCDALTRVDAPDVVDPDTYKTAAGATALASGAITLFHVGFAGNGATSQAIQSGAMSDELFATVTSTPAATGGVLAWDSRDIRDPAPNTDPYTSLHVARQRLIDAIRSFQSAAPDSTARIGQLFALLGFTSIFFGENFCAGVPLSHRDADLRAVYGQPLTTGQMFDSALTYFDSALVHAADSVRIVNLARVGRARGLLNLGRFADAATAVAGIPTNYVYNATFVTGTLHNGFVTTATSGTNPQNRVTVPEREGTNGINWRSSGGAPGVYDPRAPLVNRSPAVLGEDGVTVIWQYSGYQASNAPIRLASGVEARLIEAEAQLQAGNSAAWLATHNALRATITWPAGQPATMTDPGTAAGRVDRHFRERAFWLFLTGHRHGDLRRLVRQYARPVESVFPTGAWRDGIPYGTATSLAPPSGQLNNPNYTGCLNRDP